MDVLSVQFLKVLNFFFQICAGHAIDERGYQIFFKGAVWGSWPLWEIEVTDSLKFLGATFSLGQIIWVINGSLGNT